ncbi:hypothetical protein [Cytobacillus praedii]|uniref:hypothetical protein n=1 Tax=Cytobacillus praedii TaxID=1742358 RepID=UPI002E21CA83|nr:hypothetical protein [Cytobacillus praedii]
MANNKYTKEDLYKATSTVKRTLKNQFEKGNLSKITKTEVFDMIYPKLGLTSRRTLWNCPQSDYLNDWYAGLQIELNELKNRTTTVSERFLPRDGETVADLMNTLAQKNRYITLLEERIKKLSSENEQLRIANNGKYTKIDLK